MKRREFVRRGLAGTAAIPLAALQAHPSISKQISLECKLTGHESDWTFVGSKDWSADSQGILYSPVWTQCIARKGGEDHFKREDFAYPSSEVVTDIDLSMGFQTFYWMAFGPGQPGVRYRVFDTGIVFRAQDSTRFYVVQFDDMERKGAKYEVRLSVQDASGYRREIASGFAPNRELPERWVQDGPNPEEWKQATPGWIKARVQAQGDLLKVFVNDQPLIEVHDGTYHSGHAGVVARGPITLRNLKLSGKRGKLVEPWKETGELPSYFYPWPDPGKQFGDSQTYPGVFRMVNGDLGIWMGVNGNPHVPDDILLVWSRDDGKTWTDPRLFKKRADVGRPGYFFGHKDGHMSCMYATTYDWDGKSRGPRVASSQDGGKTWSEPEPLMVGGKPLYEYAQSGTIGPYSPIVRYSDGTLIQYYYHVQTRAEENINKATNATRLDRSLVIRSSDDGKTWSGPHYLDAKNFDSNATMGAERADGSLLAFSRTLRAPFMWTSTSSDKGITWSKQVQSNCTRECPFLLRHSSGVLVMGSRGNGIFVTTSVDEGKTWSRETRISLCSGMMGMTEMKDRRVLVVFHEAYGAPSRIRGQYLQVHKDGIVTPA